MIRYGFVLMMMVAIGGPVFSQVKFFEVVTQEEMEAAQKKADDGMQLLFVDVYATWCGPCKMMDRDVYTDPVVAGYMNENFVNVRMDGETDYGRKYAAEQQLQGYPSMFIFSDEGDQVSTIVGFNPAEKLLATLKNVVENYVEVKRYRNQYLDGTLAIEDFADYITVVRKLGNEEQAEELAGEYIKKQLREDLSDNDIRVVAHYTDLEDSWWPLFTTETDRVRRVLAADYLPAMEKIYGNSLMKAVDQEDVKLISRIANELSPLVETEQSESWDMRSLPFIQYFYYTGQVDELTGYVDNRFASDRQGDHQWLFGAASQIIDMDQQVQTPELLVKGEAWFSTCIELKEQYDYYFYHGMVLFFQQKSGEAKTSFEKAATLSNTTEQHDMIVQVLRYVTQ